MTRLPWVLAACALPALGPAPLPGQGTGAPAGTPPARPDTALAGRLVNPAAASSTVPGEEVRSSAATDVATALAGRAAGVEVLPSGGEAGASALLRIRGSHTFSGTGVPLLVVDGQPVSGATFSSSYGLNGDVALSPLAGPGASSRTMDLSPYDVESVEVLRGPAATALFGPDGGAGGVILVTTRRGRPGRTTYSLRSSFQTEHAERTLPLQRSYGMGIGGRSTVCTTPDCFVVGGNDFSWGPRLAPGTPTFDHAGELYAAGRTMDNALSLSGGSARGTFHLSGTATRRNGMVVGDQDRFERSTLRFNGTYRPRATLALGTSLSVARTEGEFVRQGNTFSSVLLGALRTPPDFDNREYLRDGLHRSYHYPNPVPGSELRTRGLDNPFYALYAGENTQGVGRFFGNATAGWTPRSWLRVDYALGMDAYGDDRLDGRPYQSSGAPGGSVLQRRFTERILDHSLAVTATRALGGSLRGSVTAGQNLRDRRLRQATTFGRPLLRPEPLTVENTGTRTTPPDLVQTTRLHGYFIRGGLGVADRLQVVGGLRADAVSEPGAGGTRGVYPTAGVTWDFARSLPLPEWLLSSGRVRAAYGESGQRPVLPPLHDLRPPSLLADRGPAAPARLSASAATSRPTEGPKPHLERVAEAEAGADLGLLGGRAALGVTGYRSESRDVVFGILPEQDRGRIRNTGWEASLDLRPYTRRTLAVELGVRWARNRNRVLSLGDPAVTATPYPFAGASFLGSVSYAEVGQPLGVIRGFDFVRCGRGLTTVTAGGITYDVGRACAGQPGGALFVGAGGFPVRDPTERVIADPNPDWTGGASVAVRFRGVRVAALLDTRRGGQVLDLTRASLYQYGTHRDTEVRAQSSGARFGFEWLKGPVVGPGEGQYVLLDQQWFLSAGGINGPRAQFAEDASVTRLRELSVTGTLGGAWVRRTLGLSGVEATLAGRNLVRWSSYTGLDPEASLAGAALPNRGIDWFAGPPARALALTLALRR